MKTAGLVSQFLRACAPALALAVLLCLGCQSAPTLEGTYKSAPGAPKAAMELAGGGGGTWKTDTDAMDFKWEASEGRLLIHTKTGGVIAGRVDGKTVVLDLPDLGEQALTRVDK